MSGLVPPPAPSPCFPPSRGPCGRHFGGSVTGRRPQLPSPQPEAPTQQTGWAGRAELGRCHFISLVCGCVTTAVKTAYKFGCKVQPSSRVPARAPGTAGRWRPLPAPPGLRLAGVPRAVPPSAFPADVYVFAVRSKSQQETGAQGPEPRDTGRGGCLSLIEINL